MLDNRHVSRQDDGSRTRHAFRDWLRCQLFGYTDISLDKNSLPFGSMFFVSMGNHPCDRSNRLHHGATASIRPLATRPSAWRLSLKCSSGSDYDFPSTFQLYVFLAQSLLVPS